MLKHGGIGAMKIHDLAELMGVSEQEAIAMLRKQDVIELNLKEKATKADKESGTLELL